MVTFPRHMQGNITTKARLDFSDNNIPWENVLSFSSDNANVMAGMNKGVAGLISRDHPQVDMAGCGCHLLHLAAQKGARALEANMPCSAEDALIALYYYIDKSADRIKKLEAEQVALHMKPHKILKLVSTRWLGLGTCLSRFLDKWEAIENFVRSEIDLQRVNFEKAKQRAEKKNSSSSNPTTATKIAKQPTSTSTSKSAAAVAPPSKPSSKSTSEPVGFDLSSYLFKQDHLSKKRKLNQEAKGKVEEAKRRAKDEEDFKNFLPGKLSAMYSFFNFQPTKMYCTFIQSAIPMFEVVNKVLQKEAPLVHRLHSIVQDQLKRLMIRFVKPDLLTSDANLADVEFIDRTNQVSNEELMIGAAARKLAKKLNSKQLEVFFGDVRSFFEQSTLYITKNMKVKDELLINASVADISLRASRKLSQPQYFLDRFPILSAGADADDIEEEFLLYKVDSDINSDVISLNRAEDAWYAVAKLCDGNGSTKYKHLPNVMLGLLSIFHSNAECERLFSLVTKNKTKFRPNLCVKTLDALTTHKQKMFVMEKPCYQCTPSDKLVKCAKSTTSVKLSG